MQIPEQFQKSYEKSYKQIAENLQTSPGRTGQLKDYGLMVTLKAPRDRELIASGWWLEVVRRSQVDRKRTVLIVVGRSPVDRQLITLQTDGYPNSPLR